MKQMLTNTLGLLGLFFLVTVSVQAQTKEELTQMRDSKAAMLAEKEAEVAALNAELTDLNKQIDILSGWRFGLSGLLGFDLTGTSNWVSSPNPNAESTGLTISGTAFASRTEEKWFWNNKLIANKAWLKIDTNTEEDDPDEENDLFDNGTVDLLNVNSLYGYRLTEKIALSAMGELNTSIESFLEPGTADIGVGATWTPNSDLTVVVHPFNYRLTWSAVEDLDVQGALGAKLRADYAKELVLAGKNVSWSSTLTGFLPYGGEDFVFNEGLENEFTAGLFEWTWLNTFSLQLFDGFGVGFTFGLRSAEFEVPDEVQRFYNLGFSYTL